MISISVRELNSYPGVRWPQPAKTRQLAGPAHFKFNSQPCRHAGRQAAGRMAPKKSSKPKVDDALISEKDREAAVTSRRLQEAALHAGVSAENPNLPHLPHA